MTIPSYIKLEPAKDVEHLDQAQGQLVTPNGPIANKVTGVPDYLQLNNNIPVPSIANPAADASGMMYEVPQLRFERPKDMVPGISYEEALGYLGNTFKQTGANLASIMAGFQSPMDIITGRVNPADNNVAKVLRALVNKGKEFGEADSKLGYLAEGTVDLGVTLARMPWDMLIKPAIDYTMLVDAVYQHQQFLDGKPYHLVDKNLMQERMDNVVSNAVGFASGAVIGRAIGLRVVKNIERSAVAGLGEKALGGKVAGVGTATFDDVVNAALRDTPTAMQLDEILSHTPTFDKILQGTGGLGTFGGIQASVANKNPEEAFVNVTKAAAFQSILGGLGGIVAQLRGSRTSPYEGLREVIQQQHIFRSLAASGDDIAAGIIKDVSSGVDIYSAFSANIPEGMVRRIEGVPFVDDAIKNNPNIIVHKVGDRYNLTFLGENNTTGNMFDSSRMLGFTHKMKTELLQYGHVTGEVIQYNGGEYFVSKNLSPDKVWISPTNNTYMEGKSKGAVEFNSLLVDRKDIKAAPELRHVLDPHNEIPLRPIEGIEGPLTHGTPVEHVVEGRKVDVGETTRFEDKAIGSGEGAQAYLVGHYFAEAPPIGEHYRKSHGDVEYRYDTAQGKLTYDEVMEKFFVEGNIVPSYGGGHDKVISVNRSTLPGSLDKISSVTVQEVTKNKATGEWENTPGTYPRTHFTFPDEYKIKEVLGGTGREVEIPSSKSQSYTSFFSVEPHEMILHDKSFWEQSDLVKNAVAKLLYDIRSDQALASSPNAYSNLVKVSDDLLEQMFSDKPLGEALKWASGLYKNRGLNGQFEKLLLQEGVQGNKFLDANSRYITKYTPQKVQELKTQLEQTTIKLEKAKADLKLGEEGKSKSPIRELNYIVASAESAYRNALYLYNKAEETLKIEPTYNFVVFDPARIHAIRNSGKLLDPQKVPIERVDFLLDDLLLDPVMKADYLSRQKEIELSRTKAALNIYQQAYNKGYTIERQAGSDTWLVRDINGSTAFQGTSKEIAAAVEGLTPYYGVDLVPPPTKSTTTSGAFDGGMAGGFNKLISGGGDYIEHLMNTGWLGKFLSPMYNKFSYFEKRTGIRYLNDMFLPVQRAIMLTRATMQPLLKELHDASRITKQFDLPTLEKITEYRETFSALEMESGKPSVLAARATNANELNYGRDLHSWSTSLDRAVAYQVRRIREMRDKADVNSREYKGLEVLFNEAFSQMTNTQKRAYHVFEDILSKYDKDTVNLYAVNRYADALEFGSLSRKDYAAKFGFDKRHIEAAERLDRIYETAANVFGIEKDLLGGYHPHYRMYNIAQTSKNISLMAPAIRSVADFVSELDRIGEIHNYLKDPFFVANQYIRNAAKTKLLAPEVLKAQEFLDAQKSSFAKTHGAQSSFEIYREGKEFLDEVLGKRSSLDALTETLRKLDESATSSFLHNTFGDKFATTIAGVVESAVQGFKPMAGIRDLSSFTFQATRRFGYERTANMLSMWRDMERSLAKHLSEGKTPGLELDQVILREMTDGNIPAPMAKFFKTGFEWSLQKQVYIRAYTLSMLETKGTVLKELAKLSRGEISMAKFEDRIWLDTYDMPVINEFRRIMFEEKNAVKAAEYLGDISARELVGHYGAANQASAFRSKFGRLMGQFSQWNTMMLQNNARMLRNGSLKRKMGTALRHAALVAAAQKTQEETGIKLSFYMPFVTNPRVGPVFSFMGDASEALGNNYEAQRQTASGAVKKELDPWRTILWNPVPLNMRNAAMRYMNGDDAALIGAEILGIPLDTEQFPKRNPSF